MIPVPVPLVSVVIATYNMSRYVGDAIASVQAQTIQDIDIHVVDDGSTDDTQRAVAPFLADPRVHYYYQANAGQTRAKNAGIAASSGRYIGFCDADDLWLPDKLALQVPEFEKTDKVGVVYTRSQPIDSSGRRLPRPIFPEPSGNVTQDLFYENFIPFGTTLVRRTALDQFGAFNERYRMGIDWELFLRLSVHYEFRHVPEITYLYRIWDGQMSSNWAGRYEHAFRIMHDFVASNPGLIAPERVRKTHATTYANRARSRANISGDYAGAIVDATRAVAHGHSLVAATRLVARCAIRLAGLSRGPLDKS